jgi:hypothetical protein
MHSGWSPPVPGRGWRDDHSIKRLTAIELVFDNGGVVLNGRAIPRGGVDGGDVPEMSDVRAGREDGG